MVRSFVAVLAIIGIAPAALSGQARWSPADSSAAIQALRDYEAACRADAGALWGLSLCGPLVLVDPRTRAAVANDSPPGGSFVRRGRRFYGTMPTGIPVANTSLSWVGREWGIALLPLSGDRHARADLLLHESFHRIQDSLGLRGPDALSVHLDERDGRYWFRLELRALATAVRSRGNAARRAALDALLFRTERHRLYPAADSLERALELQEGLAAYTGNRLAMDALHTPPERVARDIEAFASRPTYVRSAAYATGPGLGLLLDRYARGWRRRVRIEGLATQLTRALHFSAPTDLEARARRRAAAYGGPAVATEEDARAEQRRREAIVNRARYVEGPVLVLRQEGLNRSFNPNTLIPFGSDGTIYPTGTFSGPWGTLEVTGGALVASDFGMVRVPAPRDMSGTPLRGDGWTLTLAEGWTLRPGARAGDVEAVSR